MAARDFLPLEVDDDTLPCQLSLDQLKVGQAVIQRIVFGECLQRCFDELANDRAPLHWDPAVGRDMGFQGSIVQGMAVASRFSRLIGMYMPGSRAVLEKIDLRFHSPVYLDAELVYCCTVERILRPLRVVRLGLKVSCGDVTHITGSCQCVLK